MKEIDMIHPHTGRTSPSNESYGKGSPALRRDWADVAQQRLDEAYSAKKLTLAAEVHGVRSDEYRAALWVYREVRDGA